MTTHTDGRYNMQFQPLKAIRATLKFLRNKEDTSQVFRIMSALDGGQSERNFQRFSGAPTGRQVLAEQRSLFEALCARDALAAMPAGSLGRAYLDFITAEGLSPEGFQAEIDAADEELSQITPDRVLYRMRLRHAHDLWHVLTGYGRDTIGEVALLGFTFAQTRILGFGYLGLMVTLKARREFDRMPVFACFREGYRLGRAAQSLIEADWENLFALPVEEVRTRFDIAPPRRYQAIAGQAARRDAELRAALQAA